MWTSTDRLYVNSDKSELRPEESPEAKFLLCPAGGKVSDVDCQRYGLGPYATATEATTDTTGAEEAEPTTDTEENGEGPQNGSQDAESKEEIEGVPESAPEPVSEDKPRRRK